MFCLGDTLAAATVWAAALADDGAVVEVAEFKLLRFSPPDSLLPREKER